MDAGRLIRLFTSGILLSALIFSPFTLDATLTPRFLALALFLLCAAVLLLRSAPTFTIGFDFISGTYATYALFCVLSIAWANTRSEALFESAKAVLSLCVFGLTYFCLKQDAAYFMSRLQKIAVLLFFMGLLIGSAQLVNLPGFDRESLYLVTGINSHKNLFASFLFLNLFFLTGALTHPEKWWRVLAAIAILLSLCLLVILKTKAVWMGAAVGLFVFAVAFIYKKIKWNIKLKPALVLGIVLVLVNLFFLVGLRPVIEKSNARAAASEAGSQLQLEQERLIIWDKTYHLIRRHPVVGAGMGNWQVFFPDATLTGLWRAEDLNYTFQRPHNDFLWILAETGLLGFNLFLAFSTLLIIYLFRAVKKFTGTFIKGPGLPLVFILAYFSISFFDFPKERIEHQVWIHVIFAIGYFQIRKTEALKPLLVVSFGRFAKTSLVIVLAVSVLTGLLRHMGEYYTRNMLQNRTDYTGVIRSVQSAESFAYTLDPTSMPVCWYLGNAFATRGDYEQAHRQFLKAYRLNPYNRNVLNDLASSYSMRDDNEHAKEFYREASRISPRFDDPKLNLVAIYINEKNFAQAAECIKTLYHNSPRREEYQQLIDAFK